jgi:hypothetical protein
VERIKCYVTEWKPVLFIWKARKIFEGAVKDWMNLGPRLDTFIADLIASTA